MLRLISLNLNHNWKCNLVIRFCVLVMVVWVLSGCNLSLSPQSAAIEALQSVNGPNFKIDTQSIKILQTMDVSDTSTVVVISFNGLRNSNGLENCLYSQQVEKQLGFWRMFNGGGGCWSADSGANKDPLMAGGSQSGSSKPEDPGISQVFGAVNHPGIVKVSVTWDDGQVTNSEVFNGSFLSFRLGMAEMVKVEGLSDQGMVIYQINPQTAPGKNKEP